MIIRRPGGSRTAALAACIGAGAIALAFEGGGCLQGSRDRPAGARCEGEGQCEPPLVCSYGRCRASCAFDRDCPEGGSCIQPTGGGAVCWYPAERVEADPCPPGTDLVGEVCRTLCLQSDPDPCGADRVCVEGACRDAPAAADGDADADSDAEPDAEVVADADLGPGSDAGGDPGEDGGSPPDADLEGDSEIDSGGDGGAVACTERIFSGEGAASGSSIGVGSDCDTISVCSGARETVLAILPEASCEDAPTYCSSRPGCVLAPGRLITIDAALWADLCELSLNSAVAAIVCYLGR